MLIYERILAVWVSISMLLGIIIGYFFPAAVTFLDKFQIANLSIPLLALSWITIFLSMVKIDFKSHNDLKAFPEALGVSYLINWILKPLTIYYLANTFFFGYYKNIIPYDLASNYLVGVMLVSLAPNSSLVFNFCDMISANPLYSFAQISTNNLILIFVYIPLFTLFTKISGISMPLNSFMVLLFAYIVFPLFTGMITKSFILRIYGKKAFKRSFIPAFKNLANICIILNIITTFIYQSKVLVDNFLHIILISVPLIINCLIVFFIVFFVCHNLKLPNEISGSAAIISSSNFLELSYIMAVSVFGLKSPVLSGVIAGVLINYLLMVFLVEITNSTKNILQNNSNAFKNLPQ